jgi:hypothetical protein
LWQREEIQEMLWEVMAVKFFPCPARMIHGASSGDVAARPRQIQSEFKNAHCSILSYPIVFLGTTWLERRARAYFRLGSHN